MDEGKIIADFIASNFENIWKLGKTALGSIDEAYKLKFKKGYSDYLKNTREKYSKSKSFFIRDKPVDLYSYYVPIGVECGAHEIKKPEFKSCLSFSKRIVIMGTGGSGKSILMKHLFLTCILDKRYFPILVELRDINTKKLTLDLYIVETLKTYGFDSDGRFVDKAKKEGHFCFLLDGFDEVSYGLRKDLIDQIRTLSDKFSQCPVIISSRPDDVFNGIDSYSVFKILPLNLDMASRLVEKLPFDEDVKSKFVLALRESMFRKHKSFLSNPLLLSIMLLTYGENAEVPAKLSIFYNQAYEALFQRHDASKAGYRRIRLTKLDVQDFARVFSLFSLQTYEKRIFSMPTTNCLEFIEKAKLKLNFDFITENYLKDLLRAACLLIEDGLEVTFSHRSFQEYFVALYISSALPDVQERLINRYWRNVQTDSVMKLLLEINPELVERVLLLPRLEKLINEIGVKRKVGITHAAKYLKRNFCNIDISSGATFTYHGNDIAEDALVRLALTHCKTFKAPSLAYLRNHDLFLKRKYTDRNGGRSFKTKDLSYKSPIMNDILRSKRAFSIEYMQAVYDAYKKLKAKHENSFDDLGDLLGF